MRAWGSHRSACDGSLPRIEPRPRLAFARGRPRRSPSRTSGRRGPTLRSTPMKGDKTVIQYLNKQLTNELTAINQYFLHARMLRHWGLNKLGKHEYVDPIAGMPPADRLIAGAIILDGLAHL